MLLAVTIVPKVPTAPQTSPRSVLAFVRAPAGAIEIEVGCARVRLRGTVDDVNRLSVLRALRELA